MDLRKIATMVAALATANFAGWDFVPEASWDEFGDARAKATGSVWWTDSTHFGLWALDQNPAALVGNGGSPLEATYRASGTSLTSNDGGELSHSEPAHLRLESGKANTYAFRSHVTDISETWRDSAGQPTYDLSRLRWGFDAAVSLSGNRALVFGLGMDGRFPGSQSEDASGGTFKHVQFGLESFRLGMAVRIAEAVTLALRGEAGLDFDSLKYSGPGNVDPQLRWAQLTLPMLGFGLAVDRTDWPVSATLLFDWGERYRIGVLKNAPAGVNVDLPQLTTDTLRFALAVQGRPDLKIPDQNIRPSFAVHWTNATTQAYDPTPGTSNPLSHGDQQPDADWSIRRTGLVLGLDWSWMDRISARTEGEVVLEGITAKNALYTSGAAGDTNISATDARWAIGIELSHTLVQGLRETIPAGNGFCLRLGFSHQALGGLSVDPGWYSGLQAGRDAIYNSNTPTAGQLGMMPTLGARSQETSYTWGMGGWTLGHTLMLDLAMSWNTWTPGSREDRAGLGWTTQLTYRM
jgi:hypothetical protein